MKKKDLKYRLWKEYQNKKNLMKRTLSNNKKKKKRKVGIKRQTYQRLIAPNILSLKDNSEDTITYFGSAIRVLKNPKNKDKINGLLFDATNVEDLSIDALMYLLAIIQNFKNVFSGIREVGGKLPKNEIARQKFISSGFLCHVKSTNVNEIEYENKNQLKISTGRNVSVEDASKLIDFVCSYFNIGLTETKFLYKIIIELMTNTHNHAYNNNNGFIKAWYLFANINEIKQCVEITFVDTGEGIPKTVSKKIIKDIFRKDNEYIISALNGEFRTQTKEKNRGKGLPDIYEHFKNKDIQNFKLISCKGAIDLNEKNEDVNKAGTELNVSLNGTVYYWEIKFGKEEI